MNKKIKNFFKFKNQRFLNNKRALSPLAATLLLVVFALAVGTVTMNWGKSYVEKIKGDSEVDVKDNTIVITVENINSPPGEAPLKRLQIDYITGKISKEEYLIKERGVISS